MRAHWCPKIKELRKTLGASQEQLARQLGLTKKTVAEWEQGRQPPSPERALQLARLAAPGELRRWFIRLALERIGAEPPLVVDALLPGLSARKAGARAGQRPLPAAELRLIAPADWSDRFRALEGLDHYVPLPLLKDAAAAGSPREISEADIDGYALIHYAWCPNPANFTCVRVRGDSMAPILHDGAIVALDHTQRDPLFLHQKMVAARYDAGVTIKWLERASDGTLRLVPENKDYPALTLPRTPENPVIGLVAWWWNRQR
ncbi:MAG: helix-turn-helix domain-containing protein [Acidobacteria bacterium]|nr:helix-turn-helix domain-containing protein [Acidobacteriota bacterium]